MITCVSAAEFKIAQQCGLFVITEPDELEDLVYHYERVKGGADECIQLVRKRLVCVCARVLASL